MAKDMDPTMEDMRREQASLRAAWEKNGQKQLNAITVALAEKENQTPIPVTMAGLRQLDRMASDMGMGGLKPVQKGAAGMQTARQVPAKKTGTMPDWAGQPQFAVISKEGNRDGKTAEDIILSKAQKVGYGVSGGQLPIQKLAEKRPLPSVANPSSIIVDGEKKPQMPKAKTEKNISEIIERSYSLGEVYPTEILELAALRLSNQDRMRFLNETNYYVASLKREMNAAQLNIAERREASVLLSIIENTKKTNPQLANIIAKNLFSQGVDNIENFETDIDFSGILDNQKELPREERAQYYKQLREWTSSNVEKSSLDKSYKTKMIQYMSDMADEQLDRLADILAARGFDQGIGEQDFRRALYGEKGTAQIVNAKTNSIDQVSTMRPHINFPADFNPNTSFSYYYYNNGLYYTDIYYNGMLAGRLPLGKELPKMVRIFAQKGGGILEIEEQVAMGINIVLHEASFAALDGAFNNNTSASFGDFPYDPDPLEEVFSTYINNVNENTIVVTANVWKPTYKIGNDMVSEVLLINPVSR